MITTDAPTTRYFKPALDGHQIETLPRRIADAYRAGGLTPPVPQSEYVKAELMKAQSVEELTRTLAIEAQDVDAKDAAKWIAAAADQLARARAHAELQTALRRYQPVAVRARSGAMLTQAITDLAPVFDKAVVKLTECAKALPPEPFDMAAIVETDATKAAREAGEALGVLARFSSLFKTRAGEGFGNVTASLLPVVDLPHVSVQEVDRLSRTPLDPDDPDNEAREGVRALERDSALRGADATLVEVARGAYGESVRLALATSRRELLGRERAVTDAKRTTAPVDVKPKRYRVARL